MKELHDWLFHYNHYKELWFAFRREDASKYFNGTLVNPLTSKDQKVLVEIIIKTDGDEKKMKKLLKNG